jgi:hypothetical protein
VSDVRITINMEWDDEHVTISSGNEDFQVMSSMASQMNIVRAIEALDATHRKARVALEGRITPEFVAARSKRLYAAVEEELGSLTDQQLNDVDQAYPEGITAQLGWEELEKVLAYVRTLRRDNEERSVGRS